ncbi:hypothetical protein [Celerinatantimonas sp. MCCC 1A17872]|uniref:hypothetical protein n=1 Tax=Celerinatantimonas sp. MCCC 1A17872 TaxID=3177514 RepID=UPI0038C9D0D7
MKDLCIIQPQTPNLLIKIGQALGQSGINIEGLSLSSLQESSIVHLLVMDEKIAISALQEHHIAIESFSDVFILFKDQKQVTGKPGSFGSICQLLYKNGITIKFGYPAENNRFVFGVDDIEKTKQLLA